MANIINQRVALGNKSDLTTPTSTQEYPLGAIVETFDSNSDIVKQYMYVKSHTTLTQYQPYVINGGGASGSEWITGAAVTLASAVSLVGVPQVAFTSGYYGFNHR